jgi:alkylated DNA repair dioxygenase AlkB
LPEDTKRKIDNIIRHFETRKNPKMTNLFQTQFGFSFDATLGHVVPLVGGDVDTRRSILLLQRGALDVPDAEFELFWNLMDQVPETPNPMNKKYNVISRQATFGTNYRFGGQNSHQLMGDDEEEWPTLVRKMLAIVKASLALKFAENELAAHVNWYPGGKAGLAPHDDKEGNFVVDAPIFSFTLNRDAPPRGFQIYLKGPDGKQIDKKPTKDIKLGDGDLLVMAGKMQTDFLHGVKKTESRAFQNSRRINVTVRVLKL